MTLTYLCWLLIATLQGTLGSLLSYENRCCKIGQEWFATSREQCGPYLSQIEGIPTDELVNCAAIVEVCCLKEKHKKECHRGEKVAIKGDSCVRLFSAIRNEVPRECCNCCKLGLVARALGIGCTFLDKYGPPCSNSFQSCCNMKNTSSALITTSAPHTNVDINECEKFPHQLCAHICENTPGSYRCKCHIGFELQADGRSCKQAAIGNRCEIHNPCQHTCEDTGDAIRCRCFEGYVLLSDSRSCSDLNECQIGTDNCPPGTICKNTEGTFLCERQSHQSLSCGLGFNYNDRTSECEDVDECQTGKHNCSLVHQVCTNTIGSFYCRCAPGFRYNTRGKKCEDINECALSRDTCMQGQQCENTIGSYTCRRAINCGTGYTLDKESQQCLDDNECDLGTHNCGLARECRNIPGSFRCVRKRCKFGFRLNYLTGTCDPVQCRTGRRADSRGSCVDINECEEQPSTCQQNQECVNTVGSYRCKSRLNCGSGYEINAEGTGCQDVDECARHTHDCVGIQKCMNRPGTFHCMCPDGYRMNHLRRECDDIDECTRFGQVCALNSLCKNTPGSFVCECKPGFQSENSGRTCRDVNECDQPDVCEHTCRNTWGSFQCTCNPGYQLSADQKTCEDIDECSLWSNRGRLCIGICENTRGSYRCSCPKGYRMMSDGRTCQDIDECATRTANCNGRDDYCINTRGGFKCETIKCPQGFIKAPPRGRRGNKTVARKGPNRNILRSISGIPIYIDLPSEDVGVVCQRAACKANDIWCLLNKTRSIQYQHVAIPTFSRLPGPLPLIIVQALTSKVFKNFKFTIEEGNKYRVFDIKANKTKAVLQLRRPIRGPKEKIVRIRIDNRNLYDYVLSSHLVFITVHVASNDY